MLCLPAPVGCFCFFVPGFSLNSHSQLSTFMYFLLILPFLKPQSPNLSFYSSFSLLNVYVIYLESKKNRVNVPFPIQCIHIDKFLCKSNPILYVGSVGCLCVQNFFF